MPVRVLLFDIVVNPAIQLRVIALLKTTTCASRARADAFLRARNPNNRKEIKVKVQYFENTNDMKNDCQQWLSGYRSAMIIAYNDEEGGGSFDVTAYDDGSTSSFEDRCAFSIDHCFSIGGWGPIVIATNLDAEADALAVSLISARMVKWYKDMGEELGEAVIFNDQTFEMTYALKPKSTALDEVLSKQEDWLEQLGIMHEVN